MSVFQYYPIYSPNTKTQSKQSVHNQGITKPFVPLCLNLFFPNGQNTEGVKLSGHYPYQIMEKDLILALNFHSQNILNTCRFSTF
jgi:hypothetical protein